MTEPVIYLARMRQRLATQAEWESANPLLIEGEFGVEYDPESPGEIRLKLGRGLNWDETPYMDTGEPLLTDLSYDAETRFLDSSTGDGVTLPLVGIENPGLLDALPNDSSIYLDGQGQWGTPPGVCDLSYDPFSRGLDSSTGDGVTLPLVGTVVGGTAVAGLQTPEEAARLAESGSPTFAGLTVAPGGTAYLPHIHGAIAGPSYQHVRNTSGAALSALIPYRVISPGNQGDTDRVTIGLARSDDPAAMPACGILMASLAANEDGHGVVAGVMQGVNTAGLTPGAVMYVAPTGGLTTTAPSTRAQVVAVVGRVHASTGSIVVQVGTVRPTATEVGADPAGTASGAITTHLAAATHLTVQQAAAAAPVQSVAGRTGNVTLAVADVSGLGSAATTDATAYATAAQGSLAASAVQPAALSAYQPRTLEIVSVSYAAIVDIDFASYNGKLIIISTLTGNIQFTFSNISLGRQCAVRVVADGTARNLTFPATSPRYGSTLTVAASKSGRISLECTGSTESLVDVGVVIQV